jgi:hypothetical protein
MQYGALIYYYAIAVNATKELKLPEAPTIQ